MNDDMIEGLRVFVNYVLVNDRLFFFFFFFGA